MGLFIPLVAHFYGIYLKAYIKHIINMCLNNHVVTDNLQTLSFRGLEVSPGSPRLLVNVALLLCMSQSVLNN